MTPPTERCPTCDRDGCSKLLPAEHTEECRSDCPRCAAIDDCHAHRVDWRARALAAEVLVASYESPTCDHRHPCRCGSGGHPRRCMRHPKAFDAHCAELNVIAQEQNKLEEAQAAAAQWAKVAPLIERLRAECGAAPFRGRVPNLIECAAAILAATEATP